MKGKQKRIKDEGISDVGVSYRTTSSKGPLVKDGKHPLLLSTRKLFFSPIKRWIDNLDPPTFLLNLFIFDL